MVMRDDVFVMAILHEKATRNDAQLDKAQTGVQLQRRMIRRNDRVELQDFESQLLGSHHAILHKQFADMPSTASLPDGVTGVANMSATPDLLTRDAALGPK